jgi:hypothetical protein
MIIDEYIEILVNNQQIDHYRKLGYKVEYRKILKVKPMDLTIGSHYKLSVACDICNDKSIVEYRQLKGYDSYLCNSCAAKNKKTYKKKKEIIVKQKRTKKEKIVKSKDQVIRERKQTRLKRYGNENYNNQEKKRNTLKDKYGDENYNNTGKRKETLELIYGDSNFNNQSKKEETCLSKYGVRHSNQLEDIMIKIQKSAMKLIYHEDMKLNYRGSYEKDFLDFCFINDIKVSTFDEKIFYKIKNKQHRYFPDFFHKETNTIIEIKSSYTMNLNLDVNILKKERSIESGYNFIFIIDKKYDEFQSILYT